MYQSGKVIEALQSVKLDEGRLLINWLGQAGFLFKTSCGSVLCIDPYLTNSIEKFEGLETRRMWFPSFSFEEFKPDAVICTHDHLDHTDPETLPLIAAYSEAVFFGAPESCAHMSKMKIELSRIVELKTGNEYRFNDVMIKPVFARHTPGSIGLVLTLEGLRIYITGDTEYCEELFEVKNEKPDVLITCINGKYGNLNSEEAVNVAVMLGVATAIPMHYGLIPSNTVRPDKFASGCAEKGIHCYILKEETNYICTKLPEGNVLIK